jgi:hypothetical protein
MSSLACLASRPPPCRSRPPGHSPEIQEAEDTGASLSQDIGDGETRTLELARTSWAATSSLDPDSEGEEEAVARHTLEHGMTWARRALDELILPATSVSSLVKD